MQPTIHPVFEPTTCSWQYIVACPETKEAVIIDPVLNFEPTLLTIPSQAADALIDSALKTGFTVTMLLETHAHGDHLSASY
jgi:glyoxylase-like metal-dependent hydrolase (beta-lactamase superfamily II)